MKRSPYCVYFALALSTTFLFAEQTPLERKYLSEKNWSIKLRDGDMVFIRSRSKNAGLIAQMTNPEATDNADTVFTHCGIVFKEDNKWKVLEGAGRGRVLILRDWQSEEAKDKNHPHGESPHNVYVRRWKALGELTPERVGKLLARARTLHNTGYDWGFSWTDDYAYCSELIWKAYDAAGLEGLPIRQIKFYLARLPADRGREALGKLDESSVREKYRHGQDVNPEENAISPGDIYDSEKLVSVTDDTA